MGAEFDAIESPTEEVGGFTVSPVTVERIPYLTRALRPIVPEMQAVAALFEGGSEKDQADALIDLIADHGERLIDAVAAAVATDFKALPEARAKVGKLDSATFIALLVATVRVNADFFVRRLLPLAHQAAGALKSNGAGQIPAST